MENWTKRFRKAEFEIRKPRKQIIDRTDSDSNKYRSHYFYDTANKANAAKKEKKKSGKRTDKDKHLFQKKYWKKILKKLHFLAYLGISSSIITMKLLET